MTKKKEPPVQQAELPMKDVTPKAPDPKKGGAVGQAPKKETPAAKKDRIKAENAVEPKVGTAVAVSGTGQQLVAGQKSILQIIGEAASNPNFNPESMRALLNMQKEIMEEESRRAFNAAFIALQSDIAKVRITRDGKIEVRAKDSSGNRTGAVQQATPYATFNSIMKTIQPLLTRHGFALSFATEPAGERIVVRGFLDGHGHQRTTAFPLPAETSGSKNNVQGWGSSLSYGKRYCTIALLNIISEDPQDRDTDGHQGNFKPAKGGGLAEAPAEVDKIDDEQAVVLRDLIEWCGIGAQKFCAHYGIKAVKDLPRSMFPAAEKACKDFHASQQVKRNHG